MFVEYEIFKIGIYIAISGVLQIGYILIIVYIDDFLESIKYNTLTHAQVWWQHP